jgi:hypothetical protein
VFQIEFSTFTNIPNFYSISTYFFREKQILGLFKLENQPHYGPTCWSLGRQVTLTHWLPGRRLQSPCARAYKSCTPPAKAVRKPPPPPPVSRLPRRRFLRRRSATSFSLSTRAGRQRPPLPSVIKRCATFSCRSQSTRAAVVFLLLPPSTCLRTSLPEPAKAPLSTPRVRPRHCQTRRHRRFLGARC